MINLLNVLTILHLFDILNTFPLSSSRSASISLQQPPVPSHCLNEQTYLASDSVHRWQVEAGGLRSQRIVASFPDPAREAARREQVDLAIPFFHVSCSGMGSSTPKGRHR